MQNQNYKPFADQKSQEEVAVGVPINLSSGQGTSPYFEQHQSFSQPHLNMPGYDGYYGNQMGHPPMMNQQRVPAYIMPNPQIAPPLQQQQTLDYSKPINIRCPCCSMLVTTVVNHEAGNAAYLWAGLICCLVSPCCTCLPFLTNKCMDKNHYCPRCGFNILRKHRGFVQC